MRQRWKYKLLKKLLFTLTKREICNRNAQKVSLMIIRGNYDLTSKLR